ncbi:MAG: hypothetical protein H7Z75_21195 [Ferruginibacter sp.]|nr:hypothetical protein [Cytophagales bacterium]
MNLTQKLLFERLWQLELDLPDVSFPFSKRLAHYNGWSPTYAKRVVEEYKRFLFLAVSASHPVTPSEEVDQAWHLHLTYTQSYWEELCGEVLGRPLHHVPTVGGEREDHKFRGWYERTIQSYREFFGIEPPADIWPSAAQRFGPAPRRKRSGEGHSGLVPKRHTPFLRSVGMVLLTGLGLWGCTYAGLGLSRTGWITFGVVALGLAGFGWLVRWLFKQSQRARHTQNPVTATHHSTDSYAGGDSFGTATAAVAAAGFGGGNFGGGGAGDSYGNGPSVGDPGSDGSDAGGGDSGCGGGGD